MKDRLLNIFVPDPRLSGRIESGINPAEDNINVYTSRAELFSYLRELDENYSDNPGSNIVITELEFPDGEVLSDEIIERLFDNTTNGKISELILITTNPNLIQQQVIPENVHLITIPDQATELLETIQNIINN